MTAALETRHLLLLTTLHQVGTLNAAARKLHVTPSALSQQLRELEDRLGGPLFHREWRRLTATAAGRRLTEAARVALTELERAESEARALLTGARGTIRIASVCHQSYRWLPELLKAFAQRCPDVDVSVVSDVAEAKDAAHAVCERIAERSLDVALVAGEMRKDPRVRLAPLFRDELVAVVGRDHAWFARRKVAVSELAEQHVWADAGAFKSDSLLGRALASAGNLRPRKLTPVPMTGAVPLEMARANLGITVMPRWAIEPVFAAGDLRAVRFGTRGLWLRWSVATRAEAPEPTLATFLDALRRHHPRASGRTR